MSGADFLARWSRRKRETRTEPVVPRPEDSPPDAAAAPAPAEEAALTEEEIAALPSLDTLTAGTDLAPFLRKGVPALLRKAALRRMWSLDPAIRDYVSEAREYAYDWNVAGGVPGTGPLLPTDDVKAMLGRIFGDRPDGEPDAPPAPAGEAGLPDPGMDDSAPDPEGEAAPPAAIASDNAVDRTLLPEHAQAPAEPIEDSTVRQNPQSLTRVRRHGGAIPI
ncbi:hypothetical protein J2X36_002680 [Methylobacterium sp. BE186]|uniref:DUF3306 domain-containing protein n=1 Tax=Methylobacterium sp. BE186 TaxID=2817715 RepID=UPI00285BBB33|nr:DUF3306 domain-containing protein [Methylobacterium sp. BE186]MDR7037927.1 hypothetical protein [Methylobacterium sp. BE186]